MRQESGMYRYYVVLDKRLFDTHTVAAADPSEIIITQPLLPARTEWMREQKRIVKFEDMGKWWGC